MASSFRMPVIFSAALLKDVTRHFKSTVYTPSAMEFRIIRYNRGMGLSNLNMALHPF
jgi:hypothetical protein